MSVKSQQVTKSTVAGRAPTSAATLNGVRRFAGNHTLMRKESETSDRFMARPGELTAVPSPVNRPLLQRKCACGGYGGECKACDEEKVGSVPRSIQMKLVVGQAGDRYEQEADRVANQVLAASTQHSVSSAPPHVQRFVGQSTGRTGTAPANVDHVLASPGRPMDTALRQDMEQRFGRDFSTVRLHSGFTAERSAKDVNAHAYTVGHDIVFGAGRFAPAISKGKRLIAHELTHVVQQSGAAGTRLANREDKRSSSLFVAASHSSVNAAQIQRKVVDDNDHLPCRAVVGRSAADVSAIENDAASLAEGAAAAVRASPLAEPTRALVWKRFRLDYNDQLTRCRFLPEIGDRFARVASEIRNTEMKYACVATGEPSTTCNTAVGVTNVGRFGGQSIELCSGFWTDGPDEQALTMLHEWSHYVYSTRGLNDELPGGFDTAGCYEAFAAEVAGRALTGPQDTNCVPNTQHLPALDRGRLKLGCPANVFLNLSLFGGYARGFGSRNFTTVGLGLDFLFPLTRMHDWELGLGARYLRFAPTDTKDRAAYLLGVRAALNTRYRPWRFGSHYGAYVEGGRLSVAGETGGEQPYAAGGVTAGLNFRIGRQASLQILGEVGGGFSFATENKDRFKWFQTGLTVVFQFE